jgi:single-strand DNA-binding protein
MNISILSGNLATDVTLRDTATGKKTGSFKLASNRPRRLDESTGEWVDAGADFVWVKTWEKQAENCAKFLKKGSKVLVVGRISTNREDDGNGGFTEYFEVSAQNVEFLDKRPEGEQAQAEQTAVADATATAAAETAAPVEPTEAAEPATDDDIPF